MIQTGNLAKLDTYDGVEPVHRAKMTLVPLSGAFRHGPGLPRGFHLIIAKPALLGGSALPDDEVDWGLLHTCGFRHVICLCSEEPTYDPSPLRTLISEHLDALEQPPLIPRCPLNEMMTIISIARRIVDLIDSGEGVLVHSENGCGRTATVLGISLRMLGFEGHEVVTHLRGLHGQQDPPRWPQSPWQEEILRDLLP